MNILEEIQNCPVEWKELGEVCDTVTDFTAAGSFASNAKNVKYIQEASFAQLVRTTDLKSGFKGNNFVYVDEHAFNYLYRVNLDKESLVMPNVGNCGEIYYIKPENLPYENNVLGPNALLVRSSKENNRYLFHLFQSGQFQNKLAKITSNTGQTKYNKTNLKKIRIPIPPLEIQEKIVQILDKMTEYVTELTSELTSRKKQYSFYRDKLLSFEDEVYEVEWKTLGEVCVQTHNISWSNEREDKEYEYVDLSSVDRENKTITATTTITKDTAPSRAQKLILENDILFGTTRPTLQRYTKVPVKYSGQVCSTGFCVLRASKEIESNYLYHMVASSRFNDYVTENQSGTSYPAISDNLVKNFRIPVPSLDIQNRIVQVLDNFDAVCNDLNIGLPKEIELRQKQYEYFRDKLLTFTAEGVYAESRVEELDNSDLIKLLQWVFGIIKVTLGAICEFTRGNGLQKKDFTSDGFPVIHYGQIYTKYGFSTTQTVSFTKKEIFDRLKKANSNDLVMATTSENIEDVGKAVVWEGSEQIGVSGDAYIIHTSQNARYLNYFFNSTLFQIQKERKVSGTKVIRINAKDMDKFVINLPSLSKQIEIASILDNFELLISDISQGLPKEIELRQKQYEYYRDKLLSF